MTAARAVSVRVQRPPPVAGGVRKRANRDATACPLRRAAMSRVRERVAAARRNRFAGGETWLDQGDPATNLTIPSAYLDVDDAK